MREIFCAFNIIDRALSLYMYLKKSCEVKRKFYSVYPKLAAVPRACAYYFLGRALSGSCNSIALFGDGTNYIFYADRSESA